MREFLEWLQRMFPRAGAPASGIPDMSGLKTGLQILIFTVIAGVIAFLLYRFWPTLWGNGSSRRKRSSQERVILGERIQPDATAVGLFAEAEMLAGSGDIRSAIRKGYISALFELSERDLVRLARYKTNRDYLRDLRRQEKLFLGMSDLTSRFESIWYGSRQAGGPEWLEFKNQYLKTVGGVED
jgi:hypothetical protein